MKRFLVVSLMLALALYAPFAEASCSQYACRLGNCDWYELVLDTAFNSGCGAWSYTGGASLSNGTICNWTNTPYAQLEYTGGFLHTSSVSQVIPTLSTGQNNFSLQYIIEIDNMTPGDTVKVTITDAGGAKVTSETFTADTWCNSVTHNFPAPNPSWVGTNLTLKFSGTFANQGTTAKITNVALWQHI